MASLCNIFLQFKQLFKGLRVSKHNVRVSNYLVRASNPLLVIPKKFGAARGIKVRGLAQLITCAFVVRVTLRSMTPIMPLPKWPILGLRSLIGPDKDSKGPFFIIKDLIRLFFMHLARP